MKNEVRIDSQIRSVPLKTFNSINKETVGLRRSKAILPKLPPLAGNETGVAITTYGKGQVTGTMFTVPAHAQINVDFRLKLLCVTPENVQTLTSLIRSLLDASHKHSFDELEKTEVSGGASFFGFFGWGGVSASYSDTKHTMDSFGLSERNQQAIVDAMMNIAQEVSQFNYSGTIFNRDFDYDVTGNLFGIVMDATIQQNQFQHQVRFLAPNVHLESNDGTTLPSVGRLYDLQNR
jgi:hypothetical protein